MVRSRARSGLQTLTRKAFGRRVRHPRRAKWSSIGRRNRARTVATRRRAARFGTRSEYTNHYDLASSLLEMARDKLDGLDIHDSALGRVDLLFELLRELNLNTPDHVTVYVTALHSDFERRPLAEQVIDQVLSEESSRYALFERIRMLDVPALSLTNSDVVRWSQSDAIGQFMSLWIEYEKLIRNYAASKGAGGQGIPSIRILRLVDDVPPDVQESAERLRRFRNQLVHGIEVPDADYIRGQATELGHLVKRVEQIIGPKQKEKSKRRPANKASS